MANYIFDVDGTIIDSYMGITRSVMFALMAQKASEEYNVVYKKIIESSVIDYLRTKAILEHLDLGRLVDDYKYDRTKTCNMYSLMNNLVMTLEELTRNNHKLFIYTHKGNITNTILKDNGLDKYFVEVVTADSSVFMRKPSPVVLEYLCEKYNMNKDETYYVGDRRIDVESADNAGIKSILLNSHNMKIDANPTYSINDLYEIISMK